MHAQFIMTTLELYYLTNNYVILTQKFYSDITQEPKWKNHWLTNKEKTEPSYWRGKERSMYAQQNINRRRSWTFDISRSKTTCYAALSWCGQLLFYTIVFDYWKCVIHSRRFFLNHSFCERNHHSKCAIWLSTLFDRKTWTSTLHLAFLDLDLI